MITMFFLGERSFPGAGAAGALILTAMVVFSIAVTLLVSRLLSATILKGVPSAMTLELPPFRKPQIGSVIVRSIFDRTLFVLGRAVTAAAPAGLIIWTLANIRVGGGTLLAAATTFLDPAGRALGLDGVILMAFILALPANETVLPVMIMAYTAAGTITGTESLTALRALLTANGWTWLTAVCACIFFLMHWPCSTTLMTIKKETGSLKWTALALLLPTVCGAALCAAVAAAARALGLV